MKRLTLLTILLVVVGLTAGAIEIKPTFTLSGSGTLQWGIDLDTMDTGFKPGKASALSLTWIADSSDTKAGKDGWYGTITLSSVLAIGADDAIDINDPAVKAQIVGMGGKAKIGIYDTGFSTGWDYVTAIEAAVAGVREDESAGDVAPSYGANGTYFSYTVSDALMVGLEVVSNGDWTANASNEYAVALDVLATFAPLTINANVNYGLTYLVNPLGFGVKIAADLGMFDPWVGFDGLYDAAFLFDVGAGAKLTFMETVTAELKVVYGDAFNDLDVWFVLSEPSAKGLVDMLDATLTVYLLDIVGSTLEYEVTLAGGYKAGILNPYFSVTYGDDAAVAAFLAGTVGITIDPLLPLTKFNIEWKSANVFSGTDNGTIIAGVTVTY